MNKSEPHIIEVFTHKDVRGKLGVVENKSLPFDIQRIYYLYDVPEKTLRGVHAHKELEQLMIAMHGSFEVYLLHNGKEYKFLLDSPDKGLYVPPLTWRELDNFNEGVCCVLASMEYSIDDYIFDKDEFIEFVNNDNHK